MGTSSIKLSFLSVLIISVLWKPAYANDKCSLVCRGSATTFSKGDKYNYGVEGTVSIFLTGGADKQETGVKLLGQVSVTSVDRCINELTVNNLVISGPEGKKYPCPPGIEKPIQFTLEDGRVGPDICAEEDDTRRALNIKRAIISLLQTETKPSTQTDIFGACPTEAVSSQEGDSVLVHRNRDLTRCAHREQGKNDLITAIYNPSAEIKNSQILRSTLNVESKVKHGVPEKVASIEDYLYRPFSAGENGAKAKVLTTLTLTGKSKAGGGSSKCTERRTVIFENPHGAVVDSNVNAALEIVKETAKNLKTEANSKSAGLFAQVVRIFRYTNKDDLLKVYNQVKGNNLEKRVYLDALLRAGTGYSIEASVTILKSKSLSELEQQLVYLSLGNARHVNSDAIKAATSLLDNPQIPKEVYIGIGALAGVYCREHNCHTAKSEGITVLSQKLAAKLQNCKPKSKVEEDVVVAVLKGIRNVRHLEDNIIEKLVRCASDNGVKPRVRAAALEAYLADPCSAKLKKSALDIMKNRVLDSEIRIKAYLAVIGCPCGSSANEIKNLLEHEQSHQVGRFITSSLRHIRASVNPDKSLARHHYGLIRTPNKFNIDDRKYSFYRELSYNVDSAGVGGNVEQTVIFSQDSFLPRSASLNLTAELFGHQFNVLEVGGRQGNLDRVLEHFLGPKSFLRTEDPQSIYDTLRKRYHESQKKVEDSLSRGRRSVKTEVDNFDKHLKAESTPYNNELDLDLYVKIFGTDAVFLSLGDDKGFDFNKVLDQILNTVNSGLSHCKNLKQELRANLLFLDAELSYPTATGLPLKLDLVGAATGRVEVGASIDFSKIFSSSEDRKVEIKLVPSTDIEVSGIFLVDASSVAAGLKVVNNLHSSTGGHLIAKIIEGGRGFDIQFGLPIDKQEILTASNNLVFFVAEKGKKEVHVPLKIDAPRKEYSGCFDQLAGVLGLTLCGEVSIPFAVTGDEAQASISKFLARYPLTGASSVKLVLEKNNLRGYHIKGIFRNDDFQKKGFELLFDAEGSQNRRTQLSGDYVNSATEKSLKLSLNSPIKVVQGEVGFYSKPNEYIILVKGKLDAAEAYLKAGFNVQGNERRSVFRPVVEYQLPEKSGKQSLKIGGEIIREVNAPVTKYTIQGVKIDLPNSNECVDINGHLTTQPNAVDLDVKAKKGEHNLLLSGSVKNKDVKLQFQNTLNPYVNFKLDGHFEVGEVVHNDIDIIIGDFNNNQNRIIINQLFKNYQKSENDFSVITKNKIEINPIAFKLKADAEIDPKKVDVEFEAQYQKDKADLDLKARSHIKQPDDYSVKLVANLNNKGVEVFSKRDCLSSEKSNFENYVLIKGFGKYELSGVVLHKNNPNDVVNGAIGHFKISGGSKTEDIKFDIGLTQNANQYSSHAKISSTKGEFLDYLLKISHGANANGQLKLVLKDSISANGQFKVTDADGKGNGMIIIEFKKAQRKIKGDVTFVAKEPVFNAEIDVYLNFEKDNNDKVHFSTNNKKSAKTVDSKNKLVYAGKHSEVNVHTDGDLENLDKIKANVEVVLPTERCLSLKVNRDVTVKDNVANGHLELVLSDATKRGGQASVLSYKAKVSNTNIEKGIIHYEGQIDIKLKEGKQLQNAIVLTNNLEGDKFKYNFKYEVTGNLLPKRLSIVAHGTSLDSEDVVDLTYFSKGSYGDNIGYELNGEYVVKLLDKGDQKYYDYYVIKLITPYEKAHDLKYVSYFLYTEPESGDSSEYDLKQAVQVNADEYKLDSKGSFKPNEGNVKLHFLVPHVEPFNLETKYKTGSEGEKHTGNVEVKSQYGKGKTATLAMKGVATPNEYNLGISANAPQAEKFKKLDLNVDAKIPSPDTFVLFATTDVNGQVYKTQSTVVYSKSNPLIDVTYSKQRGESSRIYVKGGILGDNKGKLDVKVNNVHDVDLDLAAEGGLQNDNFNVKITAQSNKFGLKNYKVDIHTNNAGKNGKSLEFLAINDNKNVLSGSTTFISKQENKKTIIEGSGTVKVKEEQKSANFKYIRTLLTEGNEQGVETFLNLAVGESSYVAESRVTNLEYKNSYLYCEEKKQCAHIDLNSKLNIQKPGVFQHTFNVNFDLRKLGVAPEFGLQVTNEVSEKKLPQYTLDLHAVKEDKKYHLHVYSHPEQGKLPAGITISLPQRVLALETKLVYPTNKGLPFPIQGEITIHPDKRKAQYKTAARFLIDITGNADQHNLIADFGFSHPKLGKEALLKVRGNLKNGDNIIEIETSTSICHPVLGADRESKFLLHVSPNTFKFLLDTPVVKVIELEGSATVKDKLQQGELKFCLLQGKPVTVRAVIKDFQYYEFTTDESDRKLSVIGHLDPEKRVDISADIVLPGQKKNIAHGALFLQDNLVKSDYGISKENFNYFVNALKNDLNNLESRIKQIGDKTNKDVKDILNRVEPKIKELEKCYQEDLEKIYQEVVNDQTLKEISEAIHDVAQFFAKIIDDIIRAIKPFVDKIQSVTSDLTKKISEMYNNEIAPQIKQLYETVGAVLKEFFDGLIDIVAHYAALVTDFFEKHKAELQELTNTIAEIFKDLTRVIVIQLKELKVNVAKILEVVVGYINEAQGSFLNIVKTKYEELGVSEHILGALLEVHNTIRVLLPTEEIKHLADALYQYASKKLRGEKFDEQAELRKVYEKFTVAFTSLIQFLREQANQYGIPSLFTIDSIPFITAPGQLPYTPAGIGASFSLVNQILHGDVPDPIALLQAYRPRSLNLLEEIPVKRRAVVVNGQHIFTFDGRHITFPGNCRYVLAHDYVDRNFTLVLQLQNGKPKALILEDKSGVTIELKDNGQVTLNGVAHGFPIEEKDVFAFKKPDGVFGLGSLYGVLAHCSSKLEVCYIEVNGFYLGKLRGLLGDGNNELYDDFRMPNGKIASSESEFANSYRLASSCPQVKCPEHSHHQLHAELPAACEQVFGASSTLRPLSLLLDIAPFRQACIHAVTGQNAQNALHEACDLGAGYTALALSTLLPAVLPPACVRCSDAGSPKNLGDTYEIKLPNKQADILVIVETTKSNEKNYKNLVVPLVSQLVDNLKSKHISDIKVNLVGVTSKYPYAIVYDTDLKLKSPKVVFDDEHRYQRTPLLKTDCEITKHYQEVVVKYIDQIRISLGLSNINSGYKQAIETPFRPGALKHLLIVNGDPCQLEISTPLVLINSAITYAQSGITHSLVANIPNIHVDGQASNNVLGYTSKSALLLDAKKHVKEVEGVKVTTPADNVCVDIAELTGGLVLSGSNYVALGAAEQKQFLHTAANTIVQRMHASIVQECVCSYVNPFEARSVCVVQSKKESARRRK
ncbi:retinoid- and fatty-acid binding glycoprotein apolipophorin isoform 2-T2 [Aphomia sociella]